MMNSNVQSVFDSMALYLIGPLKGKARSLVLVIIASLAFDAYRFDCVFERKLSAINA
jgi:hypothetical protein